MNDHATSLCRNGLRDWLVQRVTAVVIAVYAIILIGFFLTHSNLSFASWQGFMSHPIIKITGILCLLSIVAHAWIGIWTVVTDYIKCAYGRMTIQILVILALLACLIWGIMIIATSVGSF